MVPFDFESEVLFLKLCDSLSELNLKSFKSPPSVLKPIGIEHPIHDGNLILCTDHHDE